MIAVFRGERFQEDLLGLLDGAVMSAANLTEVLTRLHDLQISAQEPQIQSMFSLLDRIEPFTEAQSRVAADLRIATRHVGLSLGDRACLALALELGAKAYTADRLWSRVDVGCDIRLVR